MDASSLDLVYEKRFPEPPRVSAYMPSELSLHESLIEQALSNSDSAHHLAESIADYVAGWVRSIAADTDLVESAVEGIVDEANKKARECIEACHSPFAVVEEVRFVLNTYL